MGKACDFFYVILFRLFRLIKNNVYICHYKTTNRAKRPFTKKEK